MSRKPRSQRQRAARARREDGGAPQRPAASVPSRSGRSTKSGADSMAVYRGLASPSLRVRWILVVGLLLFTAAQLLSAADPKSVNAQQALAIAGVLCITVFLGSGFVRHYRALYRIRRDSPEAWQPTMSFAFASLAVPLGFGGRPADASERLARRVTLIALLAFGLSAVAGSRHR
jgi:hypothetical protein